MNRIEIENRLLHEFKYLSVETLEKVLDLVSLLRNKNHIRQLVRQQSWFYVGLFDLDRHQFT
ncbi:hypothetical protein QUF54_06060 [Candidatus Marithioploca araucensis]|uniref:Uncharacterized protein n=1 Tax=Candidatus Marithioploca araucensis TaxID=70273 RepID=A0ABT7VTJ1_9GAMM|nr:hypothetical protein [Candidatus Marithioploca araucensis]